MKKYPHPNDLKAFIGRLPRWVVLLILVLLFGRFILLLLFHWFAK